MAWAPAPSGVLSEVEASVVCLGREGVPAFTAVLQRLHQLNALAEAHEVLVPEEVAEAARGAAAALRASNATALQDDCKARLALQMEALAKISVRPLLRCRASPPQLTGGRVRSARCPRRSYCRSRTSRRCTASPCTCRCCCRSSSCSSA